MDHNFFSEQYNTFVNNWTNFQKDSASYWQNLPQTWKADNALKTKDTLKKAVEGQIEFLKNNVEKQQELQNNYIDLLAKINSFEPDLSTFNFAEFTKIFADYHKKSQELIQSQLQQNINLMKNNFENNTVKHK